jgi:hypothetical protein
VEHFPHMSDKSCFISDCYETFKTFHPKNHFEVAEPEYLLVVSEEEKHQNVQA